MIPAAVLASAVRRDRAILLGALAVVVALAWWHMLGMASAPAPSCHGVTGPDGRPWSSLELGAAASMWLVMMVGMMLPIVSPWLLAMSRAARRHDHAPWPGLGGFLLGYLAVWTGYSIVAAVGQLALKRAALLSGEGALTSPYLAGGLLAVAGAYQWTPFRDACMAHCRSPFAFFLSSWRPGTWGAFRMGARHGMFCAGCCWVLMALGFVFGVMSLTWMAGLTAFLLLEKATSAGPWLGKLGGALLMCAAAWVAVRGA